MSFTFTSPVLAKWAGSRPRRGAAGDRASQIALVSLYNVVINRRCIITAGIWSHQCCMCKGYEIYSTTHLKLCVVSFLSWRIVSVVWALPDHLVGEKRQENSFLRILSSAQREANPPDVVMTTMSPRGSRTQARSAQIRTKHNAKKWESVLGSEEFQRSGSGISSRRRAWEWLGAFVSALCLTGLNK